MKKDKNSTLVKTDIAERTEGLVIKTTGSSYEVLPDGGGATLACKVKGNFRLKGIRTTNPVTVGDRVTALVNPDGSAAQELHYTPGKQSVERGEHPGCQSRRRNARGHAETSGDLDNIH